MTRQLILFFTFYFIFFPQIYSKADNATTTTPSPIVKLKERIELIDETLRNVVTHFQKSANLKQLYKNQVKDIKKLVKAVIKDVNNKTNSVKQGNERIDDCFNSVRKEIYSMNRTAFEETNQCRLYAALPISKQVESGLMMGKHLKAELDKLAHQCKEGPKMMETYCVAKKMPLMIQCMKSYRALATEIKRKMEDFGNLLEIYIKTCFQDVQMTLQKSSKNADTSARICTVFR